MWEYTSICIRTHSPPPLFREGDSWTRLANVPLSGIKPSRSTVFTVSVSYSFGEIAPGVLVTVTVTGSTISSGSDFSGKSQAMGSGTFSFSVSPYTSSWIVVACVWLGIKVATVFGIPKSLRFRWESGIWCLGDMLMELPSWSLSKAFPWSHCWWRDGRPPRSQQFSWLLLPLPGA